MTSYRSIEVGVLQQLGCEELKVLREIAMVEPRSYVKVKEGSKLATWWGRNSLVGQANRVHERDHVMLSSASN